MIDGLTTLIALTTLIVVGILFCYCIFIIPIIIIKQEKKDVKDVKIKKLTRFSNKYIGQCVRLSGKIIWVEEERINEDYTKYTMVLRPYVYGYKGEAYLQMKLDNKTERIIEGDYVTIEGIYEDICGIPIFWVNKFWR